MILYALYTPLNLISLYIFNNIQSHCYMCVGLLSLGWLELIVVMDKQRY